MLPSLAQTCQFCGKYAEFFEHYTGIGAMVIGTVLSIVQRVIQLQAVWKQQHHVYFLYLKWQNMTRVILTHG